MNCYNPIRIDTTKYYEKHGVLLSDKQFYTVPCGKCLSCLSQKAKEWTMRLSHEWTFYNENNSMFITLTYDKEHLPEDYSLQYADYQKFIKRLRRQLDYYYKEENIKIKYFLSGEYGYKKGRPHYHLILFGLPNLSSSLIRNVNKCSYDYKISGKYKLSEYDRLLFKCWKKGNIQIGYVSLKSLQYCSLYTLKGNHIIIGKKEYYERYKRIKPFRVMSKAIGKRYALQERLNIASNLCINYNNVKCSIPRSYINWIEKSGNMNIRTLLREKQLIEIDKEINQMYKDYGLQPKTINDFYFIDDYFDIYNHEQLYKIYRNKQIRKMLDCEKRHERYLYEKLQNKLLDEHIA